ncbi:hypothetical protein SAMN06297144_0224 [Sphingomonas guangdongensis]|uniref:Uncharacterized protein n=1 Tax=Sphingomonas guangdongensis TaxID=1141890 RepID=A0A285QAF0_9SPHN|nr:hypothetical protein [Sphingomonas guangdongensis]SOB78806.1 hypothetical protein SAMN06297144_0224 [Sphingomonas guangdongensis]
MRAHGLLPIAAVLLAGCDRPAAPADDEVPASENAQRAAAIASERAWIDRMRSDTQRNAALAAALDNAAMIDDPFAHLFTPEPVPTPAAEPTPPTPAPPPSEDELRAAEAAVRNAMKARRATDAAPPDLEQ